MGKPAQILLAPGAGRPLCAPVQCFILLWLRIHGVERPIGYNTTDGSHLPHHHAGQRVIKIKSKHKHKLSGMNFPMIFVLTRLWWYVCDVGPLHVPRWSSSWTSWNRKDRVHQRSGQSLGIAVCGNKLWRRHGLHGKKLLLLELLSQEYST